MPPITAPAIAPGTLALLSCWTLLALDPAVLLGLATTARTEVTVAS